MKGVRRVLADPRLLLSGLMALAALNPPFTRLTITYLGFWLAGCWCLRFKSSEQRWIWVAWNYALIGVLSTVSVQAILTGQILKFSGFLWIAIEVFKRITEETTATHRLKHLKQHVSSRAN